MGSLSPQFYHHHPHHQLQEEEYYSSLSNSMGWWFHDDDDEEDLEEEEEDNVEHLSSSSTEGTTGYLEDVLLFHYSNSNPNSISNSKRRRLLSNPNPTPTPPPPPPPPPPQPQDSWAWPSSNSLHNCCHSLPHLTHYCQTNTADQIMKTPDNEGITVSAETMEYQYSAALFDQKESSPSSHIIGNNSQWTSNNYAAAYDNEKEKPYTMFPTSAEVEVEKKIKKRDMSSTSKVVYPFALVKPRGFEGDDVATLNDINQRILMPPTRPVRHPVGDFACRPLVTSPRGPGLSGKTVVAFTRVHTQGRGTITIIRTRG